MRINSTFVQWSDAYRIGLPEIDDQHRTLLGLVNELWSVIAANAPVQEGAAIFERLEEDVITHFIAEETMMQAMRYPDFDAHRRAHLSFVERLQAERRRQQNGGQAGLDTLHFLKNWMLEHMQEDRAYTAHYTEQKKPVSFLGRFFSSFKAAQA